MRSENLATLLILLIEQPGDILVMIVILSLCESCQNAENIHVDTSPHTRNMTANDKHNIRYTECKHKHNNIFPKILT